MTDEEVQALAHGTPVVVAGRSKRLRFTLSNEPADQTPGEATRYIVEVADVGMATIATADQLSVAPD